MTALKTIGIIGAGNAAWNFAHNLRSRKGYSIEQIISRNKDSARSFADQFDVQMISDNISDTHPDLDFIFILCPDDAIAELAGELAEYTGESIVIHASGFTDIHVLSMHFTKCGVIWPVQTLKKEAPADFSEVPLFIEAADNCRDDLRALAQVISEKVIYADSPERLRIHLAAVYASNFSNYMFRLASDIARETSGKGLDLFAKLIEKTTENALTHGPLVSQTGPARRGDEKTIQSHLKILQKEHPEQAELYRMISDLIRKSYD